jgi:hypothetical protein
MLHQSRLVWIPLLLAPLLFFGGRPARGQEAAGSLAEGEADPEAAASGARGLELQIRSSTQRTGSTRPVPQRTASQRALSPGLTPPAQGRAPAPGQTPPNPSARLPALDPQPGAVAGASPGELAGAGSGTGGGLVGWIKRHAYWVLGVLGAALIGILTWGFLAGGKKRRSGEAFLEAFDRDEAALEKGAGSRSKGDARKYSTTKIRAADVNARLSRTVSGTQVETDREYALVVDEEALKMPPLPEQIDSRTGKRFADDAAIRQALSEKDYGKAYATYLQTIDADGALEFQGDLELALSEHFLRAREFDKAARILEHHVATHAVEDVHPETYFNLGYIHLLTKTLNKSRRYLKLFVESKAEPKHVDRARRILKRIENLN